MLYNPDLEEINDSELVLTSGYLTVLSAFCGYETIKATGVETQFQLYEYTLTREKWTAAGIEERFHQFWPLLRERMGLDDYGDNFEGCYKAILAVALVSLLFLVKHLTTDSLGPWYDNRLRPTLQMLSSRISCSALHKPQLSNCNALSTFWSSLHPVRNKVFSCIRALAMCERGFYKCIFESLVRNMWWAEMSHIHLIDEYITRQNPEIINMAEIGGFEKQQMTAAYDLLATLDEADRPFAKLILTPEQTHILQSRYYTELYAAARVIAELTNANIANLVARDTEGLISLKSTVRSFIITKRGGNPMAFLTAASADMTDPVYQDIKERLSHGETQQQFSELNVEFPQLRSQE